VLDVLAQVQASVQREVLAAITLNAVFFDMVLNPVQVRLAKEWSSVFLRTLLNCRCGGTLLCF
jgi:hypothetical protein